MRMFTRILAMVLAALLLTLFSLSAFAEGDSPSADNTFQEEALEEGEVAPPDEDEGIEIAPPEDDGETADPLEEPGDSGSEEDPGNAEEPNESEEPGESEESGETGEPDPTSPPTLVKDAHPVYIFGEGDKVNPDRSITRSEAAAMLKRLLDRPYTPKTTGRFKDVKVGAWYQSEVDTLAELGVINGYGDGTFRPEKSITRAEFTKMLASFAEKTEGGIKFKDVSSRHWANSEITTAAALGWINGYEDGTFRPDRPIKRCEAIVMINRALERKGDQATLKMAGNPMEFLDLPSSHWAYYEVMEAAVPHEFEPGEHWTSYSIPKTSRLPGYYNIAGELYKVDSTGHWVTNEKDGVLTFGADGRYTTGNKELDILLTQLVKRLAVEGDTNRNNYKRMCTYLVSLSYRAGTYIPEGQPTGWEAGMALEMLKNQKGNCYRYAGLETHLARKFGYQAVGVSGMIDVGRGWTAHGWTEITLNGVTYMSDSQQENYWPGQDLFMRQYKDLTRRSYRVKGVVKK